MIQSCESLDDNVLNVSRHRPILCMIKVALNGLINEILSLNSHIKWKRVSSEECKEYGFRLNDALRDMDYSDIPNVNDRINFRYENLTRAIVTVSDQVLPKSKFRSHLKPYWDRSLKDLHATMRQARRRWISEGRPRGNNHESYHNYKRAKSLFRSHHQKCAEKYLSDLNAEIDQIAEVGSAYFWKKVNGRRKLSTMCAGNELDFNGRILRDPEEISEAWGSFFRRPLLVFEL